MVKVLTYLIFIDEAQVRKKYVQNRVDDGEKKWMRILAFKTGLSGWILGN